MSSASCFTWQDNQCSSRAVDTNKSFEARRWVTPPKNAKDYIPSYQDMSHLVGYAQVQYENQSRRSAWVDVKALHRNASVGLTCFFNGVESTTCRRKFYAQGKSQIPLQVRVQGSDGTKLDLEPIDFFWDVGKIKNRPGDYRGGQKGAIVEMFGWPDGDVESECDFIARAGYLGVKLFPHQEQLMSNAPFTGGVMNPWYFMYQPVSYRLEGRMGSRGALRALISGC